MKVPGFVSAGVFWWIAVTAHGNIGTRTHALLPLILGLALRANKGPAHLGVVGVNFVVAFPVGLSASRLVAISSRPRRAASTVANGRLVIDPASERSASADGCGTSRH